MVSILRCLRLIGKLFVILIVLFVILTYQNHYAARRRIDKLELWRKVLDNENMKYILLWSKEDPDLSILKKEQEVFFENKCLYNNCYVTNQKNFSSIVYTNFDAIIITARDIYEELPKKRYSDQHLVFATRESADNYPICGSMFDDYFNLTWTYKLDSDIVWTHFTVDDKNGVQVAPKDDVKWTEDVMKFSKKLRKGIMNTKKFPVAWFSSNCYTRSKRELFVVQLKQALKWYGIEVHVVGTCGTRECPKKKDKECMKILGRYYFYLAFENSFAEDYVSEKVLKALLHYTVPVVFGGADYSRFLPPHSYINARELGPRKTAAKLAALIMNKTAYLEYFNWHHHYTINLAPNSVCKLCELLNKPKQRGKVDHSQFRKWWNEANETCQRRPKRQTIRSKLLSMLLGSTCSMHEAPHLISFFSDDNIFNMNKRHMARQSIKGL